MQRNYIQDGDGERPGAAWKPARRCREAGGGIAADGKRGAGGFAGVLTRGAGIPAAAGGGRAPGPDLPCFPGRDALVLAAIDCTRVPPQNPRVATCSPNVMASGDGRRVGPEGGGLMNGFVS